MIRPACKRPGSKRWCAPLRTPFLALLLALAALAASPASSPAQTTDTAAALVPAAPAPAASAPGRELWLRLRGEVSRLSISPLPEFRYARRWRVDLGMARLIEETARAEGIDPDLAFRLVYVESRFNPRARSYAGALGLAQLMPGTARAIDRSVRTREQILEPRTNLTLGFRYLRRLIDLFDGDVRLALLAYNRGEGRVMQLLRAGRDPENGYSHRVLGTRTRRPYQGTGLVARAPQPEPPREREPQIRLAR